MKNWKEIIIEGMDYKNELDGLLAGNVKPSKVVGGGYKNGKAVASGWLRMNLLQQLNPSKFKLAHIMTSSSGKAFKTEAKAKSSKSYKHLNQAMLDKDENVTINGRVISNIELVKMFDGFVIVYWTKNPNKGI